jgi:hypothetical protein
MPLNEFLASLPFEERTFFMPCPFCRQGDHFSVASVDGIKIFYCEEFSQPFFSKIYDQFIRDEKITVDLQKIDLHLNGFTPDGVEIAFERFNPFLEHVNWEELLQTAIESGMTRDLGRNQRFASWIHEFGFPIGLRGEHFLKVEVFLGDERVPAQIFHVYPIQHEGDDSWRKEITDRYS